MPEEAVIDAPTDTHSPGDTFDRMMALHGNATEPVPEVTTAPVVIAPVKTDAAPVDDGLPPELLGKPAAPVVSPEEEFDKLVSEPPKGQIKSEQFKQVQAGAKKEVERYRAELAALKADLEKRNGMEAPEPLLNELKTLKQAKADMEAELERAAYERSPKFKEKFVAAEERLKAQITRAGKDYELSDDDIASLSSASSKRRGQMIEDMDISQTAKGDLAALLRQKDMLDDEKASALSQSREQLTAYQREQKEAREEQQAREQAEETRILAETREKARQTMLGFKPIPGNPKWEAERTAREERVASRLQASTVPELIEAFHLAEDHPILRRVVTAQERTIAELIEKVARLTAAGPGGGAGPADGKDPNAPHVPGDTFDKHMRMASRGAYNQGGV